MKAITGAILRLTKTTLLLLTFGFTLGVTPSPPSWVYGEGIVVDQSSSFHASTLKETSKGITQIDIVAPDKEGQSHNKFVEYNVPEKGVVINNNNGRWHAEELGYVERNSNLKDSGTANRILFEITGASRSQLEGTTWIVGKEADFILVNPNGIVCNGGGFINTPSVVLSTQGLDGRFVGDIVIGERGLNNLDGNTYLRGKKIEVHGPITTHELIRMEANLQKDELSDESNLVAIDIGEMAHIKAGSIYMIATGDGIGVRSLGKLESTAENIVAEVGGNVSMKGETRSARDISLMGQHVDAENMQASILNVYTKGYTLNATGIRDSVRIIDLDADGERTLEYTSFLTTAPELVFVGKSFKSAGEVPANVQTIYLDLKGKENEPSFINESLNFLTTNFTCIGTGSLLNTGKMNITGSWDIEVASLTNQKKWAWQPWATDPNRKEQVAIPGSGEIYASTMRTITTEGDFLDIDGGIIKTTDPEGSMFIDSNGKIEVVYFNRTNGRGDAMNGYDFQGGHLGGMGNVTLLSRTREVNNKASVIEVGGLHFYTSALNNVTCTSVDGTYLVHTECYNRPHRSGGIKGAAGRKRNRLECESQHEYPKLQPELRLNPNGNVTIITELGDICLDGLNMYCGSVKFSAGRDFINTATKVHNNFGLGGSAGAGGNQLEMGDIPKLIAMGADPAWLQKAFEQNANNPATGSGFNFGGGNVIGQNGITVEAGRNIVNNGGFIGAVKGDTVIRPGISGEGALYNGVLSGTYIDSHVREKNYEALTEAVTLRPGIIASVFGNVLLDAKNRYMHNNGIIAAGEKVYVDGKLLNTPHVAAGQNYEKRVDRGILQKVTTEQWTSNAVVSQPMIYGKKGIEFEPDAELFDQGGYYYFPNGTCILPNKVHIEDFVHESKAITKVTEKGMNTFGLWETARAWANGASSKQSLSYVPFINAFMNLAEMQSVTDLQPVVEAVTTGFQAAEAYARNYLAMAMDGWAASIATAKTLLDIGPIGVLPDGLGVYEKKSTYEQTTPIQLRTTMQGQDVICNIDKGYIEGLDVKASKGMCFTVNGDLEFAATEVTAKQDSHQEHKGVGVRIGKDSFSVSGYYQAAEAHNEQTRRGYVRLEAPYIEFNGKGTVSGPVILKAHNVTINELNKLRLDSIQDTSQLTEKEEAYFGGLTWTSGSPYPTPSVGIAQGRGKGHSNWVNEQGGIEATGSVNINIEELYLDGTLVNAPAGKIQAKKFEYNDIHNEEKYTHTQLGVSIYSLGDLLASNDRGTLPTAPPEVDNKVGTTSIFGMINFGYDNEEKQGITRATVAPEIEIETESDISGLNRDLSKAQEITYEDETHFSIGVPMVNSQRFAEDSRKIKETAQDLKNKLVNHFDQVIAQIPADQPEIKAKHEAMKEELGKIAEDVAEVAFKLVNDPNAQEIKILEESEQSILRGKPMEEANLEELLLLSNEIHQRRVTVRDSEGKLVCASVSEWIPAEHPAQEYRDELLSYGMHLHNEDVVREVAGKLPMDVKTRITEGLREQLMNHAQMVHALKDRSIEFVRIVYENREVIITKGLDGLQVGLDIGGVFVPIVLDVTNAGIHVARGHYGEAMISLAAAIPIAGDVAIGAKYTVKGVNAAKKAYTITKADKEISEYLVELNIPKQKLGEVFQEVQRARQAMIEDLKVAKTTKAKGILGETASDIAHARAGFEKWDSKLLSDHGIDRVYVKRNLQGEIETVHIVEAKMSSSGRAHMRETNYGKQMSDPWIEEKIAKMEDAKNPEVVKTAHMLKANKEKIVRKSNVLDPEGWNRWNRNKLPESTEFK